MPSPAAIALGASVLLPIVLEVVDYLQGDPEATVSEALKQVQATQEREVLARTFSEEKGRAHLASKYHEMLPMDRITSQLSLMAQDVYRPPTMMPRGGSRTVERVADAIGVDPNELKARFDPRQEGFLRTGNSLSKAAFLGD